MSPRSRSRAWCRISAPSSKERGGTVGKTEYWGLKSLTFRIKKNRKAHYSLMNIDAPHAAVTELERQMSLSTDIIRFLTVKSGRA